MFLHVSVILSTGRGSASAGSSFGGSPLLGMGLSPGGMHPGGSASKEGLHGRLEVESGRGGVTLS